MTTTRPTTALVLLTALGVGTSLLLSGCSLLPSIPTLGGDSSNDGSSGNGDGDSAIEDIEDNPFLDHTVPDTFPSDVPLPDLDVLFSLDLGTGWSVVYKAYDPIADLNDLADEYTGGSWEELSRVSDPDTATAFAVYDSDKYQVQMNGATDDTGYDTPILSLTVVKKD
jgi:hypothetical protein